MMNFLQTPWGVAVLVIILLVIAMVALYFGKRKEVYRVILALVEEAENKWTQGKTGELKYAYVIGKVYPLLPPIVRLFISEGFIDMVIEESVQYMKEMLKRAEERAAAEQAGTTEFQPPGPEFSNDPYEENEDPNNTDIE